MKTIQWRKLLSSSYIELFWKTSCFFQKGQSSGIATFGILKAIGAEEQNGLKVISTAEWNGSGLRD